VLFHYITCGLANRYQHSVCIAGNDMSQVWKELNGVGGGGEKEIDHRRQSQSLAVMKSEGGKKELNPAN
jgi:hypothetical protein